MIAALAILLIAVQIEQPFPGVAPLHHIPTALAILAAPWALRRWPLSNAAVLCIAIFLALHMIGGRYTYVSVPYDGWSAALFGATVSETFGFHRNHYDRLVHFAYGLLALSPSREILVRHLGLSNRLALFIAVESVIAFSAAYELFEWFLSIVLAGSLAADYNGQQGDIWDAQKDMALAAGGALIAALFLRLRASRPNSAAGSSGRAASG